MAILKTFLVCFLNDTNSAVRNSDSTGTGQVDTFINALLQRKTYVFSLLFFGNLTDNSINPRLFIIFCELGSVFFILMSLYILFVTDNVSKNGDYISVNLALSFCQAGMQIITIL